MFGRLGDTREKCETRNASIGVRFAFRMRATGGLRLRLLDRQHPPLSESFAGEQFCQLAIDPENLL